MRRSWVHSWTETGVVLMELLDDDNDETVEVALGGKGKDGLDRSIQTTR